MKRKLKLTIQYDGHRFLGWQKQKEFSPTVQETIESALKKIFKVEVSTIGAGRTDTGVHALGQEVVFVSPFEIPGENLKRGLNANLPQDIKVINIVEVSEDLRPTNDAISKEYRYLFTNTKEPSAFQQNYISNYPFELDLEKMNEACKLFVGKHDFLDFHCKGSGPSSTVREILTCELAFQKVDMHGIFPDHHYLKIVGTGFLKQMVRLIMGSIWSVGRGKLSLEDLQKSLESPSGKPLAAVAPPEGLYKFNVEYPQESLTNS